jgi:hypothetical protein
MDLLGVVAADLGVAEQAREQSGAGVGDLGQDQPRPGDLGEDREHAGAGRGFEHQVGRCEHRRFGGGEAEGDRRRKLLELLGFLRAAGLRGDLLRKARQHVEHCRGRAGARAHRRPELAQEHDLRRLSRLVGVLPCPRALGIAAAKRRFHGGTQSPAVDGAALTQQLREQGRGMDQARHPVGRGLRQEQRQGGGGRRSEVEHDGDLRERGQARPEALSPRPGSPAHGCPLPLARGRKEPLNE